MCDIAHNPRELIAAIDSLPATSKHPFIYRDGNNSSYMSIVRDQVIQQMETRLGQVKLSRSKKRLTYVCDFGDFTEDGRYFCDVWLRFIFEPYEVPFSVGGPAGPESYMGTKVSVQQAIPIYAWPSEFYDMDREQREQEMRSHLWVERHNYLQRPKTKRWGTIIWTIFWDGESPYNFYDRTPDYMEMKHGE